MNHTAVSPSTLLDAEIYPNSKDRFYPKLSKSEIKSMDELFCVGPLLEDRCFSIEGRPTKITKKAKEYFGLNKDYKIKSINDWNNILKGKEVLLVYSKGTTNYKIVKAKVINMFTLVVGYPYHSTGINLEVDGEVLKKISLKRVFIPAKNSGKTSTLDVNAPEFIHSSRKSAI